jgi:hypothetical protein
MKNLLLLLCLLSLSGSVSSYSHLKKEPVLKGRITDEKKAPVPFATVILKRSADSVLVKGEVTDENGAFAFESIREGAFFLEVQVLGYEKLRKEGIQISSPTETLDLGTLSLKPSSVQLKTVDVQAEKPFIERYMDKTVVNVEHSSIHAGSSVIEVMEKLPGVQVSQEGVISLKGKQGVIVMMDGKPTPMSGQDLGNMLKGMSSGNVQKIEIITNPSARYDAAGNAGILNIVMKKNRMDGLNGSVTAGYGQGVYPKSNSSFNLNYKKDWYNLFFSYGYSRRKGFNNLRLTRNFFGGDTLVSVFETNNYIIFPFSTHTPRAGVDFTLSPKSSLSFLASGVVNSFRPSAGNHTDIFNGERQKVNSFDFTNRSKDSWYNYSFNTQLRHRFDTTQRELTVDLDYARYWNRSDQRFTTTLNDAQENFIHRSLLIGDQDGELSLYSAKADYVHPLGKSASFEGGWKSSYVTADNDVKFYNTAVLSDSLDMERSNHFLYSENINALYVNLKKEAGSTSIQLGLRGEQTLADGEQLLTGQRFRRDYLQLFPSLFIEQKFTEKHSANLTLSRRIDRPAYQQMNPFRRLIDATTYSEGNPYLRPQLTYNAELTYDFSRMFFVTGSYSLTTDNITDVLIQDSEKRVTVQSIVNIDRFNYFSLNLAFTKRLMKWWNTNTSLLSYYGIFQGTINRYSINQGQPSFSVSTSNSFSLTEGLSMECSFMYNYRNLYGVTLIRPNYNLSLGVQKSLLKKQGTLNVNVSDIFWKAYPRGITHFGNVDEYWMSRRDTRVVNVSFTYRFGKGQAARMRRKTGADEEKSRIGSGG